MGLRERDVCLTILFFAGVWTHLSVSWRVGKWAGSEEWIGGCVYVCMCVCVYVCMYVRVAVCVCAGVFVCVCVSLMVTMCLCEEVCHRRRFYVSMCPRD